MVAHRAYSAAPKTALIVQKLIFFTNIPLWSIRATPPRQSVSLQTCCVTVLTSELKKKNVFLRSLFQGKTAGYTTTFFFQFCAKWTNIYRMKMLWRRTLNMMGVLTVSSQSLQMRSSSKGGRGGKEKNSWPESSFQFRGQHSHKNMGGATLDCNGGVA